MSTTIITSNDETFTQTTYNGISILVRDSDSYVNVSKMLRDLTGRKKRIDKLLSNGSWIEYFDEFKTIYSGCPNGHSDFIYKLNQKYNNKTQGWYFDSRLVNYVAIWAFPKYAITVSSIMDLINERSHLKNISFEENMKEINEKLTAEINDLKSENISLKSDLSNLAVPENNCDKILSIVKKDEKYILSADSQKYKNNYFYQFIFPASMNVKQIVKKEFGTYEFDKDDLTDVINFIFSKEPKLVILND